MVAVMSAPKRAPSGDAERPDGAVPQTDIRTGLTAAEAADRLAHYGPNALNEKSVSTIERLARYFWGPIPWMIEAAAVLSAALSNWADFAIIVTMLLVNAGVDFWQESKAGSAIDALKQRLALTARVLRDARWQTLPARDLVPGDVVRLRIGNVTPADMTLAEGDYLSADESALTGESLPVEKKLGETAYSGSVIKQGEMTGIVSATGMKTYFGKTAELVQSADNRSHFQRAVLNIGNFLILTTIALVALIILVSLFRQAPFWQTLQFCLILTVAAIPVALPTVLSVTMAVGAEKLAAMKAIVSRLVSIEELAGVDVLCADKTGTLTKNELTLADVRPEAGVSPDEVLLAARLASNADDPDAIDKAVLAAPVGKARQSDYTVGSFTPFDPVSKRTQAAATLDGQTVLFSKGAPQVILDLAKPDDTDRRRIEADVVGLAAQGFRALGVARQDSGEGPGGKDVWRFLGLIPIFDPPRDDAAATIATAERMGLSVKMITGDHEAIARQIAGRLGLGANVVSADRVFDGGSDGDVAAKIERADGVARVLPEHKFKIVQALQARNHIVAMTGDGVNDAPALKQADAGIAVSGATDAARAAADVVLTGQGLAVVASAIEEARRIFERMTSYATFRIAETIRVLMFMTLSILIFDFYPVTAIMIVLLAVLNDFPIMMIAYDNAEVAEKPVRWEMPRVLTIAACLGLMGVVETFLLFWYVDTVMHLPRGVIQTIIFLKLLVAGHLTIYVTRNKRWFWNRPWPSARLFLTCEATQILGTLIAVYGLFVTPIGWTYAAGVWIYALAWLPVESLLALAVRRLLDHAANHQTKPAEQTERHVSAH
ncbi:plasma-membrane proton-efflux P-type ATPase [Jiella sp. M17.18]|uniref:plasma-membrane proton-efflux P-type ATPase n=1 Tax=Jiella sp. M17.18 TaxID=3234247 RepID=UPI0034DEF00B